MFRFVISLSLVTIFTAFAFVSVNQPLVGIDDANIFFVYAKNLAHGHGFVYNIGGEHVEGFTSLLWVLVGSAAFYSPTPEFLLLVVNVILVSAAAAALLTFIHNRLIIFPGQSHRLSVGEWIFLAWVLFSPGYIIWSTLALMENGLWSALLVFGAVTALGFVDDRQIGVSRHVAFLLLILLVLLARPEGMLWALVFIAVTFAAIFLGSATLNYAIKHTLPAIVTYGVAMTLLTLFRVAYFSYPLPNTYYAKVSPNLGYTVSTGMTYFLEFVRSNPLIPVCLGAMAAGLVLGGKTAIGLVGRANRETGSKTSLRQRLQIQYLLLSVLLVVGLAIPVYVGGDGFALFRFYQPLWPLLILPLYFLAASLEIKWGRFKYVWLLASLLIIFFVNSPNWVSFFENNRIAFEFKIAQLGRGEGKALNQIFTADKLPSVGVVTAGGIALTYSGEIIDLMGLNNTAMAHSAGDRMGVSGHTAFNKALFYQLDPDLILPKVVQPSKINLPHGYEASGFTNKVLKGLLYDDRFINSYTPAIVQVDTDQQTVKVFAFFANDYLEALEKGGKSIEIVNEVRAK